MIIPYKHRDKTLTLECHGHSTQHINIDECRLSNANHIQHDKKETFLAQLHVGGEEGAHRGAVGFLG
jgi:hypothetical protein